MNRILAIGLIAVWLVPISSLFVLPKERAALSARAIGTLLHLTEDSAKEAPQFLNADMLNEMRRNREVATAIAGEPQLLEHSLWQRWTIELLAVIAGLIGIWALWSRPRYWKVLAVLGVLAFAAIAGLHVAAKLLWTAAGSADLALKVLGLYLQQPATIVTHIVGPVILLACLGYVVFSKSRIDRYASERLA